MRCDFCARRRPGVGSRKRPVAFAGCEAIRSRIRVNAELTGRVLCAQRLYRTLSELKAEVEGAIRSGRRAAERAGAGGPRGAALSARVDALKELYNRLGARVTDAKGRLEGALVASREMHADLQALAGWLDSLAARPPRQTLELEMSRMEGLRDKLNAAYEDLERACGGAPPESLRAQVARVNARWAQLRRRSPPSPPPAASPPPAPDGHPEVSRPTLSRRARPRTGPSVEGDRSTATRYRNARLERVGRAYARTGTEREPPPKSPHFATRNRIKHEIVFTLITRPQNSVRPARADSAITGVATPYGTFYLKFISLLTLFLKITLPTRATTSVQIFC